MKSNVCGSLNLKFYRGISVIYAGRRDDRIGHFARCISVACPSRKKSRSAFRRDRLLCRARSTAKLLRIDLENWVENSRGAGAVRIKFPSAVAYLYPGPFKCEEMRDECRPFPSNSSVMAGEHRECSASFAYRRKSA